MTDSARTDLKLPSEADWLKVWSPREGTLRLELATVVDVGDTVRVDLQVGDGGPVVVLRGEVVIAAGTAVTVALGPAEREKINYLNGFVRGGLLNLRQKRRLPVRLPVTFGGIGGPVDTVCRDIGDDGIFIVTERPLPETTKLHMFVRLPGQTEPLQLTGTVGHTVVPADGDVPGMGVTFVLDAAGQATLSTVLDALEAALASGTLPASLLG